MMRNLRIEYLQWPCKEGENCLFLLTDEISMRSAVSIPCNAVAGTIKELKERLESEGHELSISCFSKGSNITDDYMQEWYPVIAPLADEKNLVDKLLEPWIGLET